MVVIPDAMDAFIAGNIVEMGAKLTLKATKYDPMLERSLSELGIPKNMGRFQTCHHSRSIREDQAG